MIQAFEIWLKQNESLLYSDAIGLFKDSLKCFKNDIDRPSYLLAYQGMMVQIKETIRHSKMPEGFPLQEWKDLQKKLNDPNDWDNTNYTAVVRQKLPLILVIPDNVRKEFEHWRNLRNVCAHYKEYCFVKAHTLTLYAFIVQYLLNISVEGGIDDYMMDEQYRLLNSAGINERKVFKDMQKLEVGKKYLFAVGYSGVNNPAQFAFCSDNSNAPGGVDYKMMKEYLKK